MKSSTEIISQKRRQPAFCGITTQSTGTSVKVRCTQDDLAEDHHHVLYGERNVHITSQSIIFYILCCNQYIYIYIYIYIYNVV